MKPQDKISTRCARQDADSSGLQERVLKLEQWQKEHAIVEEAIPQHCRSLDTGIQGNRYLEQICCLLQKKELSEEEVIRKVCNLVPDVLGYPKVSFARVILGTRWYESESFIESSVVKSADICVAGNSIGRIEAHYSKSLGSDLKDRDRLEHSQDLLDAVARRIACCISRKEEQLNSKEKDIALKQLWKHIEREKEEVRKSLIANIENRLMPTLMRVRKKGIGGGGAKLLNVLQRNIEELTSLLSSHVSAKWDKLTPVEIEICSMIKNGLTAKEMAAMMHLSHRTIETHRNNIRKKMGLSHKKKNLTTFLKSLS